MTTAITKQDSGAAIIEQVLVDGNLSRLTPEQRVIYYRRVCDSLGLNYLTKPFDYIVLNNKLTLYARKDATDQLRKLHGVSITRLERDANAEGVYIVVAYATDKNGRQDSSIGAVNIEGLKGEARANAMMKAETKAKRRVTLSICGLGMLDETEVGSISDARPAVVDMETGEIVESAARAVTEPPAPDFRAVYARQYAKAIDLGLSVVKDGYTLPPRLDGIGDDKARKMADWLSEQIRAYETPATEQAA